MPSRRASSFVLLLIAEILALRRRAAQPSHSEQLVEKAKFLMEENIYSEINLSGIGETLGVSTSHLNEVFKSYTAMTPCQYFISIKMRKAKELLERGDLSIKEVAFRLADLRLSLSVGGPAAAGGQLFRQGGQDFLVLRPGAHRDADVLRQGKAGQGPDDQAATQQTLEHLLSVAPDTHADEISL